MVRILKIFTIPALYFLINLGNVNAQVVQSTSATGHIFAEIIPVFSAREIAQLNFGRFSPGPQGGKIVLSPQNTISVLGSVFIGTGSHNAASYYVTGDEDASYSISLPSDRVILSHTSSSKTMTIEELYSVPAPGVGTGMLQNGFQVVSVGATLNVGTLEDNPVGIYTGTYTITFDFN